MSELGLELDAIRKRHNSTVYNCANAELRLSQAEDDRGVLVYEIERMLATIERLEIEKHDLAERLAQAEASRWRDDG